MLRVLPIFAMAAAALVCGAELPAGVPKGSTEVKPGVYKFIDKDKKVWIYRNTPFGFQKSAEEAAAPDAPKPEAAATPRERTETPFGESKSSPGAPVTRVIEQGDAIRFERPSPFGVYRWTRKKSELTTEERSLWEAQRSAPGQADKK